MDLAAEKIKLAANFENFVHQKSKKYTPNFDHVQ